VGQKRSAVVNRHDRRKAEGVEICSVEICSVEICSVGICSVEICSVGICSVDICSVEICSVEICSVEICSVEICSVEICSVEICSVEICSVEICSVEICRASSREGGGGHICLLALWSTAPRCAWATPYTRHSAHCQSWGCAPDQSSRERLNGLQVQKAEAGAKFNSAARRRPIYASLLAACLNSQRMGEHPDVRYILAHPHRAMA